MIKPLQSLSSRVFLVLFIGIVASVCLTLWMALSERQASLLQSRESHSLERAEQMVLALDALPADNRDHFIKTLPRWGIRTRLEPNLSGALVNNTRNANIIADKLGPDFRVTSLPPIPCPFSKPAASDNTSMCERFAVTLHDNTHISFTLLPPRNPLPPISHDFYQYLLIFSFSIAGLAYLVTRMTIRPLQQLSKAARDLGNNLNQPPLPITGATELKQASQVFNAMQTQIRHHIKQRTHMLAAITHDLQTPLTRLRLRIEKVADPDLRERLINDLSAIQHMVREGLHLARSMDDPTQRQIINLDSLLDSVVNDAVDAGQPVTLTGCADMSIRAQPQALSRCINNLIDNAIQYGRYATISVHSESNNRATIRIRDGGPGIPEHEIDNVFTPFYRLETSRSRTSGGTGLGLTIARNICEQQGGTLTIKNHPEGGLEVTLQFPAKRLST